MNDDEPEILPSSTHEFRLKGADPGQPRIEERPLSSNLPDLLPVLPGESDLVRIYFADLIADVLKANQ